MHLVRGERRDVCCSLVGDGSISQLNFTGVLMPTKPPLDETTAPGLATVNVVGAGVDATVNTPLKVPSVTPTVEICIPT